MYISNEYKNIFVYILLFLRLNFTRCQAKNQHRINSRIFKFLKQNHQAFFTFSNFTSDSTQQNHHLSKFATGLSQHITQNQSIRKIRKEYHRRWLSTFHENDPRSWRWRYHGNDLTTRQKEIVREKIKSRQRVLCFIFDVGCVLLYVGFRY